jgi:chemotaxis signal transduction protein
MNMLKPNMFRYLPVSANGHVLGIPFASIRQILSWSDLPGAQAETTDTSLPPGEEVVMIHLGHLMTGTRREQKRSQIIVIDAAPRKIALIVDSIAPMKAVEPGSYFPMPAIFTAGATLFGGAIRDHETLTLMLDPQRLAQGLASSDIQVGDGDEH